MRNKTGAQIYLEKLELLDIVLKNKLLERKQWQEVALGITASVGGERVQSSGSQSKIENAIIKVIDMETEIAQAVEQLINKKREVIAVLEQLDNPIEYNLLHMRYVQFMDLQSIADHYKKEYGWATTTHGRAIAHVQRILDGR